MDMRMLDIVVDTSDDGLGSITIRVPNTRALVRIEIPTDLSESDWDLLQDVVANLEEITDRVMDAVIEDNRVDEKDLERWLAGEGGDG